MTTSNNRRKWETKLYLTQHGEPLDSGTWWDTIELPARLTSRMWQEEAAEEVFFECNEEVSDLIDVVSKKLIAAGDAGYCWAKWTASDYLQQGRDGRFPRSMWVMRYPFYVPAEEEEDTTPVCTEFALKILVRHLEGTCDPELEMALLWWMTTELDDGGGGDPTWMLTRKRQSEALVWVRGLASTFTREVELDEVRTTMEKLHGDVLTYGSPTMLIKQLGA